MVAFEVIQHSDSEIIVSVIDGSLDYIHADGGKFQFSLFVKPLVFSAVLNGFFGVSGYV